MEISDPNFGNLWPIINLKDFNKAGFSYGDIISTKIYCKDKLVFNENILFQAAFGDGEKGKPIIYNNELMK